MTLDIHRLQDDSLIKAERTAPGDRVRVTAPSGPDLAVRGAAVLAGLFLRRGWR